MPLGQKNPQQGLVELLTDEVRRNSGIVSINRNELAKQILNSDGSVMKVAVVNTKEDLTREAAKRYADYK